MNLKFCLSLILFVGVWSYCQQTISGKISDSNSGEPIIGAIVYDFKSKSGVLTNNHGYFSLKVLETDSAHLRISMIGYHRIDTLLLLDTSFFNIGLVSNSQLDVVNVYSGLPIEERGENGVLKIPMNQVRELPSISGEHDIIRAYQLMPGVRGGKEGTSGIYVRGGSPDQNLFILDDLPLYYVNHIGGFVSIFDIAAVKDVTLYKGGFPAKYGGRISSVVDFQLKEGNTKKTNGEFTTGIIASKIFIEGPIKKDTSTFFLSARRSNIDLFSRPLTLIASDFQSSSGYTFFDINTKLTRYFKNNSKVQFICYYGRDKIFVNSSSKDSLNDFKYQFDNNIQWGNLMAQLKYSKSISSRFFLTGTLGVTNFYYNTSIGASQYDMTTGEKKAESNLDFQSGVIDLTGKFDFEIYYRPKYKITTGMQIVNHVFTPGVSSTQSYGISSGVDSILPSIKFISQESQIYWQNDWKINRRCNVNFGVNLSGYFTGNAEMYSLQPRLSISFFITEISAINFGYSRMNQNIHLLSNSGTGLPTDLWVPSTVKLPMEIADQVNFSYVVTLFNNFEISAECYWKEMRNLIDYKEGSNYLGIGANWESVVVGNGKGTAKGLELLVKKNNGRLQGWMGYTLSENTRQFEGINNSAKFHYKYDSRHVVTAVLFFKLNPRITLTGTWLFNTGNPITLAQEKYDVLVPGFIWSGTGNSSTSNNLYEAHIYEGKNSYRLPAYHRLDLGLSIMKEKKRGTRTWHFGIYNAYNKQNPFFLYYKKVDGQIKLFQLSLFPLIPSFSYTFSFK